MKEQLQLRLGTGDIVMRIVNIEGDPELEHRYGARVPVLVGVNRVLCEGHLDDSALDEYLS